MGTQYKLSISVENIVGEGEISDEITFTFAQNIAITNSNNYFYISWNAPSSSNRDNNNGYKIHLSDYIVQTKLNYYNLVYDSEKGSGINKYKFENGTNILILENKIYYVYIVAYNSAGQSNKVFTPFRYGKFPYNLKLNDLSKTNNFSKIQFKNNLSGNILPIIKYSLNKNHLTTNTITEKEYQISEIRYDSNGNFILIDTDSISTYIIGNKILYKLKSKNEIVIILLYWLLLYHLCPMEKEKQQI